MTKAQLKDIQTMTICGMAGMNEEGRSFGETSMCLKALNPDPSPSPSPGKPTGGAGGHEPPGGGEHPPQGNGGHVGTVTVHDG